MSEPVCPWDIPLTTICPKHGGVLLACPADPSKGTLAESLAGILRRVGNLEKGYRVIE